MFDDETSEPEAPTDVELPPPAPKPAEHLPASAFGDLASRHTRHRDRHRSGIRPEIVDESPQQSDPAVNLISRPPPATHPTPGAAEPPAAAEAPPAAEPPAAAEAPAMGNTPLDLEAAPAIRAVPETKRQPPDLPRPAGASVVAEGQTVDIPRPSVDRVAFRDPEPAGQYAQFSLLVLGLVTTLAIVSLIVLNNRIADIAAGAADGFENASGVEGFINSWVRPPLYVTIAATLGLTIFWNTVVYRNLKAVGRSDLRVGPWGAVWAWLVPGVNLVLPKRLIDDAWRGTGPDAWRDKDWKLRDGATWTNVFWGALMASIALTFVGWRVGGATVETALDANGWAILGLGALVVATIAGVRMIAITNARQLERAFEAS